MVSDPWHENYTPVTHAEYLIYSPAYFISRTKVLLFK